VKYNAAVGPKPKRWLAADGRQKQKAVLRYHRRVGQGAPDPQAHANIHVMVEDQLATGDGKPPAEMLRGMMQDGRGRHNAVHAMGVIEAGYAWAMQANRDAATTDPRAALSDSLHEQAVQELIERCGLAPSSITYTFRYPSWFRILGLFGACFFAFLWVLSADSDESLLVLSVFGFFVLLCLGLLIWATASIKVSANEISWHWLGREKRIPWDQIGRIRHHALSDNLRLYRRNGSCSILVDSQINGYLQIVEILYVKRPDLWDAGPSPSGTFRKVLWPQLLLFGGGGVFMGVFGIKGLLEGEVLAGLGLVAFAGLAFAVLLTQVQAVTIRDDELVIKYVFRKQRVKASSVEQIRMVAEQSGSGTAHAVVVHLKNGKKISLVGFREGAPKLFYALGAWLERNSA